MSLYETLFVVRPDLTPAKVAEITKKYASVITDKGGKVLKQEDCGLRDLAYKIQKNHKAYYVLLNMEAPGEAIIEMERLMRLDENLLRYLTTKIKAVEEGPSALLEPKHRSNKDDKFETLEITEGEE